MKRLLRAVAGLVRPKGPPTTLSNVLTEAFGKFEGLLNTHRRAMEGLIRERQARLTVQQRLAKFLAEDTAVLKDDEVTELAEIADALLAGIQRETDIMEELLEYMEEAVP